MPNKYSEKEKMVKDEKSFKSLTEFFIKFEKLFENKKIDEIVNHEFSQQYTLLPLLVKARMYYDEQ